MKARKLTGTLFMVCLLVVSTNSFAAKPTPTPDGTGTLTGKVLVAGSKTTIADATVTAVGSDETYTATTDNTGAYKMFPVTGGYSVTASANGYKNQTFSVFVRDGKRTKLNFALSPV